MSPKLNEKRLLPRKHNPLLAPDKTPDQHELIKMRRLGQTHLTVKPGQVGTSNATKPENLGMFDYAHLKAPLPKNLQGSEIFAPNQHQPQPEAYFLMRRSNDGYISATGMFKASFPWAKISEEHAEREHIKSLESTSQDEVAGNVWIPESYALELAEEYGILPWITALLDRSDIAEVKNPEDPTKSISPPPKFLFTANDKGFFSPPHSAPRGATPRARGRPRASSPIKNGTPAHKAGTARKPRATKSSHAANAATARDVSASLQATLDRAASIADSESVEGEKAATGGESVLVEVESAVEVNGDLETTSTNVKIEMPSGSAELPLPENPEQMIKTAKVMVNEARRLNGDTSNSSQRLKRKVEELDDDDDDEANERESPPTKRTRLVEQQVTREGMGKRTIIGVTAAIALGTLIPYMLS